MIRLNERQWLQVKGSAEFRSKGSQGEVYKTFLIGRDLAIKVFHDESDFSQELIILSNCACEYVVSVFGMSPKCEALMLDWYPTDLDNFVKSQLPEPHLSVALLRDVAKGLAYIHEIGYIHLDIRPKNILVRNGRAVICDFGVAIVDFPPRKHIRAPDMWCAPEIVFGREVSTKTDIYSYGLVVWFVIESRGANPFPAKTTTAMIRASMLQHERRTFQKRVGANARTLNAVAQITKRCWLETPEDRPEAMTIGESFDHLLS